MLAHKTSSAIIAVSDIARAKAFYADTMGLTLNSENESLLQFQTGDTKLVVYKSDYAGTNKANAAVWGVGDEIETIVDALRSKGVQFEHYPGMDYKDGIHSGGPFKMVWFKDPDGNILHLNNM